MTRTGQIWKLCHGDQLLGELTVTDGDFPWLNATFIATDAFVPWRAAFDDELRLLDDLDDHVEDWEAAYRRIDQHLTLHDPRGPTRRRVLAAHRRRQGLVALERRTLSLRSDVTNSAVRQPTGQHSRRPVGPDHLTRRTLHCLCRGYRACRRAPRCLSGGRAAGSAVTRPSARAGPCVRAGQGT
jgi:hypothetical protein